MTAPTNGFYKTIAITLMGMVATGLSAWLMFGQDNVNRTEFNQLRTEITVSIDDLRTTTGDLRVAVERLTTILEER